MSVDTFIVRANRLNLRRDAGLESPVVGRLARGTSVVRLDGGPDDAWWKVQPVASDAVGYVARRYLGLPPDGGFAAPISGNGLLWTATQEAIAAGIGYKLGNKNTSQGKIDCSGWVAEITLKAFNAANALAEPEVVFDRHDFRALNNHSDGIITGIEARTGGGLHGDDVSAANLREGMLVGCNFGTYGWEANDPPRRYGIDHIVQVVRDPDRNILYITQSSSSEGGVNLQPLDRWLAHCRQRGLMAGNRIHAVDPFRMADPHTSIVNPAARRTPLSTAAVQHRPAFSGRGAYVYTASGLRSQFGSLANAVAEMTRCHLRHIWVRIHGRGYVGDEQGADLARLKTLIALAQEKGISVAGWGWCQGEDPSAEAALALRALNEFGLRDYVADIEQGVNDSRWTATEVLQFISMVRNAPIVDGLGISSHGFIEYQEPGIFRLAAAQADILNPQAYWYADKPNRKMLNHIGVSDGAYPLRSPASYAKLCFDRWTKLYGRPVVLTGQAAPEGDLSLKETEDKLAEFLPAFQDPPGLVGTNFWHWGATSQGMRDTLAAHAPAYV